MTPRPAAQIREFAPQDAGQVAAMATHTLLDRAARTRTPGVPDPTTAARSVIEGLPEPDRPAFVAVEAGEVTAFLGARITRLTPEDEAFTYLPPSAALVPLSSSLAVDPDAAVRHWPALLQALRESVRAAGVNRIGAQALVGDHVSGSLWRSSGLRPDTTLAFRPLASDQHRTDHGFDVRPADLADVPALADLLAEEIVHHSLHTRCGVSAEQSRSTLERIAGGWLDHDAPENVGRAFVADDPDAGVVSVLVVDVLRVPDGSSSSFILPARHGYVGLASTTASHRGRGASSALVARALRWLRELPDPPGSVALHHSTDNVLGAAFWSRHGFAPTLELLSGPA